MPPCPTASCRYVGKHLLSLILMLVISACAFAQTAQRLPPPVRHALQQAGIPETAVAVVVQDLARKQASLRFHADQPFNPASLMKLLTTRAALDMLGPDKTWQTDLLSRRPPQAGVLDDDLILRGSGDPALTLERFWLLLHRLRAQGVHELRGNLVLDRSLFDPAVLAGQAAPPFDAQPLRAYNVAPDALLVNLKTIRLRLTPVPASPTLHIIAEPHPDNLDILNQIEAEPAETASPETDCRLWKEGLRASVREATATARAQLRLEGRYPVACGPRIWSLAPLSHPDYVFGLFRQLWKEAGGRMTDKATVRDAQETPATALLPTLVSIESPPLHQIIIDINKHSNNVMARQLYLALGQTEGPPLSPERSETALRRWLNQKEIYCPQLVLENGAGLSRQERICADCLTRLLIDAWHSPLMPEFIASLPLVGVDGTMKKRLTDDSIRGQAHIKTGSLDNVSTLAGYVRDARGRWQAVVFLVNHPQAAHSKAAQDALLRWVYAGK